MQSAIKHLKIRKQEEMKIKRNKNKKKWNHEKWKHEEMKNPKGSPKITKSFLSIR